MFMNIGLGLLLIWLMNTGYIVKLILDATPGWFKDETKAEDLVTNFITNTTQAQQQLISSMQKMSAPLLLGGITIVLLSFII
jgi:hypothetical protein